MKSRKVLVLLFSLFLILCVSTAQARPKGKKHGRRHKVVRVVPDPLQPIELKPLHEDRIIQNQIADKLDIPTVWDNDALSKLTKGYTTIQNGKTVKIPPKFVPLTRSKYLTIKVQPQYRYTSGANFFLESFSKDFHDVFKRNLEDNSSCRTVARQRAMSIPVYKWVGRGRHKRLKQVNKAYNSNAAVDDGDLELLSLHTKCLANDIRRAGRTFTEIEWIRKYLIDVKKKNIGVFPIEERTKSNKINCWHIVVFDPVAYKNLIEKKAPDIKVPVNLPILPTRSIDFKMIPPVQAVPTP